VATKDDVRVAQSATGEFAIHQFKDFSDSSLIDIEWEGQTNVACTFSTVYLQIYNQNTSEWDTLTSNNTADADTDFSLIATSVDTTDYLGEGNIITCRVYQEAV